LAVDRNVEHTLARVVDLDVRVAVLTVLDHAPLTEQRVRLVEKRIAPPSSAASKRFSFLRPSGS
jgi:hypothetical protein